MNKNSKNSIVSENDEFKNTTKNIIFKPKEVKISNIDVSDLKEGATQPLAYINYKDDKRNIDTKLLVQTGMIKLTGHGIPQIHEQFYPTDEKREFIKIPLDPEQESCNDLRAMLEKVDQHFGSNEMKEHLFGPKKAKKYEYQPCIRTQINDDDDEEDDEKSKSKKDKKSKGSKYPKYDFVKMKFSVINEDDKRVIKTKMMKVENGSKMKFIPQTISDIAKEIRFKTNVRLIFYFNKVWANTTPSPGSKVILYGLGFKVIAMEYQSNADKGIDPSGIDFRSDDEEHTNVKNNKISKNTKENDNTKTRNKKSKDEEKEDSENSVDNDVKKVEKDEDNIIDNGDVDDNEEKEESQDEKSEDEIPIKKGKKTAKKEISDEEEEEIPAKKEKKPAKKKANSDEEEEIKPMKKSKAKSKSTK